jgi:hypothetical protein
MSTPNAQPAGRITASCGHLIPEGEDTLSVVYRSQACDALTGFSDCTIYAEYCTDCARSLVGTPEFISVTAHPPLEDLAEPRLLVDAPCI